MENVLKSTETTGRVFSDVPPQFAVVVINPSGNTFPTGTFLEYAVRWVDGEKIADADLVWKRRSTVEFKDDSGATQGGTIQLFNNVDGLIYRVVTGTAGITAVVGQAL